MMHLPASRWQAFLIHLLFSLFLFVAIFLLIRFIWYPGVYLYMGGLEGLAIAAIVDVVVGPLLTLLVYNREKPEIKKDMLVILMIQLFCLLGGLWAIEKERPVLEVLAIDTVYVYTASDIELYQGKVHVDSILSSSGPFSSVERFFLDLPQDIDGANSVLAMSEFVDELPGAMRFDLYKPMTHYKVEDGLWRGLDFSKGCQTVSISSSHFVGEGCYNNKDGITVLNN